MAVSFGRVCLRTIAWQTDILLRVFTVEGASTVIRFDDRCGASAVRKGNLRPLREGGADLFPAIAQEGIALGNASILHTQDAFHASNQYLQFLLNH